MQDIKLTTEKHAPALQAILLAMRIRRYGAERIAQYGRSRATLDAAGHLNWASICPVLPRRTPWSSIWSKKFKLWGCEIAVPKLALIRYKTDPLLSSLKQQAE
jgi:hypothetical protein